MLKTTTYLAAFAITLSVAHAANPAPMKKNYISIGAVVEGEVDATNTAADVSNGYTLAYGRRVNDNLSFELGYTNLVDLTVGEVGNEIDFLSVSGLLHFGVGKSRPFVKTGYVDSDVETGILDASANGNNDGFLWGAGLDWQIYQ